MPGSVFTGTALDDGQTLLVEKQHSGTLDGAARFIDNIYLYRSKLELLPDPFFPFPLSGNCEGFPKIFSAVPWAQSFFCGLNQFTFAIEHFDEDRFVPGIFYRHIAAQASPGGNPETHFKILAQGCRQLDEAFFLFAVTDFESDHPVLLSISCSPSFDGVAHPIDKVWPSVVVLLVKLVGDDPLRRRPRFVQNQELQSPSGFCFRRDDFCIRDGSL